MRTHLFRGVCAMVVVLALAASAFAQSVVRGKVQDPKGQPVEGATILFEAEGTNRKMQTTTDKKGEFLQVGLQSGPYTVTASKDGIGTANSKATVRQGPNNPLNFTLTSGGSSAATNADRAAAQKLQALAGEASAALRSGDNDGAIAKFTEVLATMPTCGDCYYNIGVAQSNKKDYAAAEAAYKKAIEIKPDHGDAYTGLATLYNQQKKFDLAAEASANASKYASAGGGGNAEASYNQGVILFNGQKFAEAKTAFEAAVKADPNHALAQYQLGMTALNLGQIQDAVNALEAYLKVDPNGPKAAEVKASLPALQGMLKK